MAKQAHEPLDPARQKLTEASAARLSAISGLEAQQLAGTSVTDIREKLGHLIDPHLLFFRRVCGQVVKTDPGTGIEYPVPYATVEVEDTDCSLLGYFPADSPWAWYFPFACHREVIAHTRTDACGNFCVWVPRWDIDWVLRWRAERVCYPVIFERPNLYDVIKELIPERIPRPHPDPDPGPLFPGLSPDLPPIAAGDRAQFESRLAEGIGQVQARRFLALDANAGFGTSRLELDSALASPAYRGELAPPLPVELKLAVRDDAGQAEKKTAGVPGSVQQLAARLRIETADIKGLDLRSYIGPFKRCYTKFAPQWWPIIDVPDITFRVTQDVDGDGDEEPIYSESYFQVRWNAGTLAPIKIETGPHARAGLLCGPDNIACADEPAIVMAGRLPVANVPTLYDSATGYALRTNRPHPTGLFNDPLPNPDAASPLMGVVSLYGCTNTDASATTYRVMFEFSTNHGASFSAPAPFVALTWPLFRLDAGGLAEWHYPASDANGWYPIALPAGPHPFLPQDLILDWPTGSLPDGLYRLRLQLGTGGATASSESEPVSFTIDNSGPTGPLQVEWGYASGGPFEPLSGICPVVRRGTTPADTYFRVTLDAAATHLRSAQMWASGCGNGGFEFVSGSGGAQPAPGTTYEHWHDDVGDNDQTLQVIYRLPGASTAAGTYSFGAVVASRAFNPSGADGGHLYTPPWQYDPAPSYILPSVAFSVFNANP